MQRVYSHPNPAMVHHLKHLLKQRGIEVTVRGEHLAGASGGVAPIDAWVELWVLDEGRLREAAQVVEEVLAAADDEAEPWACPNCGEEVEAPFAVCWNCGAERPGQPA